MAPVIDITTHQEIDPLVVQETHSAPEMTVRYLATEILYELIAARRRAREEAAERLRGVYQRARERGMSLFEERRALQLAQDDARLLGVVGVYI